MVHDSCVMNVMLGSFSQQNWTLYMWNKPNQLTSINILLSVRWLFLMSNVSLPLIKSADSCTVFIITECLLCCACSIIILKPCMVMFFQIVSSWSGYVCVHVLVDNFLSSVYNFNIILLKSEVVMECLWGFSSHSHYSRFNFAWFLNHRLILCLFVQLKIMNRKMQKHQKWQFL